MEVILLRWRQRLATTTCPQRSTSMTAAKCFLSNWRQPQSYLAKIVTMLLSSAAVLTILHRHCLSASSPTAHLGSSNERTTINKNLIAEQATATNLTIFTSTLARGNHKVALFSCPRGPNSGVAANELLALRSWLASFSVVLLISPNASLLGPLVRRMRANHRQAEVHAIQLPDTGGYVEVSHRLWLPSIATIFAAAEASVLASACDFLVYVNSDIVLPPVFAHIVVAIFNTLPLRRRHRALISGLRYDCAYPTIAARRSMMAAASERIFESVARAVACTPHPPTGKDYFAFQRGFWKRVGGVPSFAIGRKFYDNFFIEAALRRGLLIDATPIIPCIHLNHDRAHDANNMRLDEGPQSKVNERIMRRSLRTIGVSPTRAVCGRIDGARLRACPVPSIAPWDSVHVSDARPACCQSRTCCRTDAHVHRGHCMANASRSAGSFPDLHNLSIMGMPLPSLHWNASTWSNAAQQYARLFGCHGLKAEST